MSEVAEFDPILTDGQSSEAPVKPEESPEWGLDGAPDKPSDDLVADGGQSDTAEGGESPTPEAETDALSREAWENLTPDERFQGYLRHSKFTRNSMDLGTERRAFESEREQERQRLHTEREEWLKQRETAVQQSQTQPALSRADEIRQFAGNPELSGVDRAGMEYIANQQQTIQDLSTKVEGLVSRLETMAPDVEQAKTAAAQMTQEKHDTLMGSLREQVKTAKEVFGEETFTKVGSLLAPYLRDVLAGNAPINPDNGKAFTIPELVGRLSGRSLEEAQKAREGNLVSRQEAKTAARAVGTSTAPSDAGGPLSEAEAVALIKAG